MIRRLMLIAALALAAAPAHGASKRAVQRTLRQATKAFKAKDYAHALSLFRSVEADIVATGDFAGYRWNVARTLEELGQWDAALKAYDHYLTLPDSEKNKAGGRARKAAILAAHYGRVKVSCAVPGATVSLVGAVARPPVACPANWGPLPVGDGEVVARSASGVVSRAPVHIQAGQTAAVELGFPALISVKGPPGAAVLVDGRAVGALPMQERAVRPGWRLIAVESPDHPRWESRVKVMAGAHLSLDASSAPPAAPQASSSTPWILAAGSAALLGVGVGMYLAAADAQSQATDAARAYNADPDPATRDTVHAAIRDHVNDFETYRALSYTSLGLGVVAAGVATWLVLDAEPGGVAVVPALGGATVLGSF